MSTFSGGMDGAPRQLVLLRGGRKEGDEPGSAEPLSRDAFRVIPGGPAGSLEAAIEETVLAARRMRREIEERIARALNQVF